LGNGINYINPKAKNIDGGNGHPLPDKRIGVNGIDLKITQEKNSKVKTDSVDNDPEKTESEDVDR